MYSSPPGFFRKTLSSVPLVTVGIVRGHQDRGVQDRDEVLVVLRIEKGDPTGVRGGRVAQRVVDVDVRPVRLERDVSGAHHSDVCGQLRARLAAPST